MEMEKFKLGKTVMTQGIDIMLKEGMINFQEVMLCLAKHSICEWGDICEEDRGINEEALLTNDSIMSVYKIKDNITIWIITEADRSVTTLLLPSEY